MRSSGSLGHWAAALVLSMAFTYSFDTAYDISVVRLLVSDTDASSPIFTDAEVQAAIDLNNSQQMIVGLSGYSVTPPIVISYRRAAATLLQSLANNISRIQGVIKVLDITADGTKVSSYLRDQAKDLIEQEENAGYFAVAEMVQDQFSLRNRIWNQMQRLFA
jgi:hypothetical protein